VCIEKTKYYPKCNSGDLFQNEREREKNKKFPSHSIIYRYEQKTKLVQVKSGKKTKGD